MTGAYNTHTCPSPHGQGNPRTSTGSSVTVPLEEIRGNRRRAGAPKSRNPRAGPLSVSVGSIGFDVGEMSAETWTSRVIATVRAMTRRRRSRTTPCPGAAIRSGRRGAAGGRRSAAGSRRPAAPGAGCGRPRGRQRPDVPQMAGVEAHDGRRAVQVGVSGDELHGQGEGLQRRPGDRVREGLGEGVGGPGAFVDLQPGRRPVPVPAPVRGPSSLKSTGMSPNGSGWSPAAGSAYSASWTPMALPETVRLRNRSPHDRA